MSASSSTMARSSDSEILPFLNDENGDLEKHDSQLPTDDLLLSLPLKGRRSWCAALIYACLTMFNALWFLANVYHSQQTQAMPVSGRLITVEPRDAPIEEDKIKWGLPVGKRSPFTSYNPDEADAAWETRSLSKDLGWLKVAKEELNAMGETSVEFHDGSGYLVYMDVFHQLHCLNYLRKKLDPWKASYPHIPSDDNLPEGYHVAHCIDSIRLSLECHADLSVVPQRWADGWLEPWPVVESEHVCRNYTKIQEWARARFPHEDMERLYHPTLGKVSSGHLNVSALPVYGENHDEI
ncbi:hypothetical protein LZ31DRAFT_591061 [Colletotrichum somersetense]|nr:hypothetical protein LZ31DRAFT_591061 [Colletotrichum somersetense]